MMSEARFTVAYSGPGVDDGTMSVRQLAPALLEIGALVEESNRVLNGDAANVSVRIRPSTVKGSALVELTMQFGLAEQVAAFVSGGEIAGAEQLLALLGFLDSHQPIVGRITNLIEFVKALGGKEVVSETRLEDGSTSISVAENDGEINNYTVNNNVYAIADIPSIRKHLDGLVSPMDDPRIDEFQVRDPEHPDKITRRVEKRDRDRFRAAGKRVPEEDTERGEFIDWVTVRKSWTVEPTRKWQFANSTGSPFNAVITDEDFWDDMARDRYAPTPHAKFKVRVRWTQRGDSDPEHTVTEVLDYQPASPRPEGFDIPSPSPTDDPDHNGHEQPESPPIDQERE